MTFRKGDPVTVISKRRRQFGQSGIVRRVVDTGTFVDVYMSYEGKYQYHCYFEPGEIRLDAIVALGMLAE